VEDLFFNAPVRKRFLRSPSAEVRLIHKLVVSYALAFPQVDFRLQVNGKELLALLPGSPLERLEQIHGARFREKVLPVEGGHPRAQLSGWVGIPEIARAHTQAQTFLVNRRWVSHPPLAHALRQGFGDLLPPALQPFAILMLEVSGGALDVNVHPTKREIRFLEEALVYAEVLRAVREATRRLVPGFSLSGSAAGPGVRLDPSGLSLGAESVSGALFTRDGEELARQGATPALVREGPAGGGAAAAAPMVPLWQLQDRYLVAQTRQGILIVDQHAAHERVLYEQALRSLEGGEAASQQILFPAVVELSPDDRALLDRLADDLARLGIHVEPFGEGAVILRSVPVNWEADPAAMLRELLEDVAERTRRHEERTRALAASFACHSAIRSGTRLDLESMNRLIDELFSTGLPHGDPHGRPTYLLLSIEELDRRFGRT
jgi:DNA mismatch repair protein MutL